MQKIGVLESILFIAGDDGINLKDIMSILEIDKEKALELLNELSNEFQKEEHGISLECFGDNYKFVTTCY